MPFYHLSILPFYDFIILAIIPAFALGYFWRICALTCFTIYPYYRCAYLTCAPVAPSIYPPYMRCLFYHRNSLTSYAVLPCLQFLPFYHFRLMRLCSFTIVRFTIYRLYRF